MAVKGTHPQEAAVFRLREAEGIPLERTGLTEQTRRCLMGIWLEAEKALNREKYGHPKSKETERRIAARAGGGPAGGPLHQDPPQLQKV